MEVFRRISAHILRCTYAPGPVSAAASERILPDAAQGPEVPQGPEYVTAVRFSPRPVYRLEPDGAPRLKTVRTVDGERTQIENLKSVYDHDAWEAELILNLQPNERLYGLGQDEDGAWNKRGRIEYLYQHNMKIPMPMVVSSRGYALLADCGCLMTFDSRENPAVWHFACVEQLDLYVLTGTMDEIVAAYRTLTGRAAPMPDWVFGYWQSKERYTDQAELLEVARRYRAEQIPLDVVVQDWKTWEGDLWGDKHPDKTRYPDLASMRQELERLHVHSLVSVWPNMNGGGRDHREFAQAGQLLPDYSTYNAFDAKARQHYYAQASQELLPAFDGLWCDNTEPFPTPDWCGENKRPEAERYRLVGGEHEKYLGPDRANLYALYHARGLWENRNGEPLVNLTRAGWTGIQQYGTILWAGDASATWQELRREIAKGMSISLCGIPYWTVDAGAFFTGGTACWRRWSDNPTAAPVWFWAGDYDGGIRDLGYQELYTRWLQFACFLPVFRSHGTDTPREVWQFDQPFRGAIEAAIRLRYRLMPYILDMARRVTEEHFTMMRSLFFDFPQDAQAWTVDDEFLFGRDLLVCPVTVPMLYEAGSRPVENPPQTRPCYLPQGSDWYDFHTGICYRGGQTVRIPLALDHIPVFARAGAEIPIQEGLSYVGEPKPVTCLTFPLR